MAITQLRKPGKAKPFLVYDFEWIPGTLEIRVCGVFDGERYRYYRSVKGFLGGELTASNTGKWFFAHFGGGADFQFVLDELTKHGNRYRIRGSFSGSSAIIVTVYRDRYSWTFVDSYWLMRDSLKNIGKWIGLEKGEGVKLSRDWYATAPLHELVSYNERDCVILYKAVEQFQALLLDLGGQLKKTIAGCAMNLFRSKYLTEDIFTNQAINNKARESYFASRVEVFETTCDSALYYDINSSFPFAMTFPMPGNLRQTHANLPDRLMYEPDANPFLIRARFTVPPMYMPPIPYRIKGRVFFPAGQWEAWLTSVDFALLVEMDCRIDRIFEVMEFNPFYDLADYANDIYNRRKNSSGFIKLAYKYLANSLYGKFGESPEHKQTLYLNPDANTLDRLTREGNTAERMMPGVWIETLYRYVPHEHVPIATHITAIARRTLFRLLCQSEQTYYCDTDGFATTSQYLESNELGGLKLEKRILEGRFVAPKLYDLKTVDGRHIIKGKGFSLNGDVNRYEAVIASKEIEIERMHRIRENLAHKSTKPIETVTTKTFRGSVIPKRFFYPDGTSRPWYLSELKTAL